MRYPGIEQYLIEADPVLGQLIIDQYPLINRPIRTDYFYSLVRTIIGQQISTKVANKIFTRLEMATSLKPARVLALDDEDLRLIGLSRQKKTYIQDLAINFVDNSEVFNNLEKLSDDDVISSLVRIKGIGVWSAQMLLIFTLNRQDIFAPDDRGLQVAIERLYKPAIKFTRADLIKVASKWSPQRTRASLYLWQSLHNNI